MRNLSAVSILAVFVVAIMAAGGWISNAYKVLGMLDGGVTALFIARCVGVVIAPLGAVLGYL